MTEEITNYPDILQSLSANNSLIWFMYHKRRWEIQDLKSHPRWASADQIFLVDQECILDYTELDNDPRLHIWDSSIPSHPNLHTYLFWFDWVRMIDEELGLSSKLVSWQTKHCDFLFDCLLGTMRTNRRFVFQQLNDHDLFQKCIIGSQKPTMLHIGDNLPVDWVAGVDTEGETNQYKLDNIRTVNLSCLIPYKIYNQSWYSIVTENCRGRIFYTEKTAKPLIANRLFVMFGEKHTLKNLRNFGFKTFNNVIDESYDNIDDEAIRWGEAWKQVEYLSTQNPVSIYQKISLTLDHNRNLMMQQNWYNKMCKEMQQLLTII